MAVEFSDDIGKLTPEEDKNLEQTFKNPFLIFKCDICESVLEIWKVIETPQDKKTLELQLVWFSL